ncbi:MAG: hypothetical protein JJU46_11520 [Balneolaceae bacterium]|nr:hypothetical protein [Balneolaceae bacterium]MCH8547573.1 hypothetical protein [Balneolaceae bacterium]
MFSDPVVTLVFLMGILISVISTFGFYQFKREELQDFEEKRERKLSYRTNEEFIGGDQQ